MSVEIVHFGGVKLPHGTVVRVIVGLQPALTGPFAALSPDFGRTYTRSHAARYCSALIKLANPSSVISRCVFLDSPL